MPGALKQEFETEGTLGCVFSIRRWETCSLGNDCHSPFTLDLVVDVPESEMAMTRTSPPILELSPGTEGLVQCIV